MSRKSPPSFPRRRPLSLLQGLAAGALLATAGLPAAQAQDAAPGAQAAAQATRRYDIPAGPLSATLTRFLGESGLFLAGSTELAQGRTSPGVQGVYSAPAALRALLAGTGLQARIGAGGGYTLEPAPQPAPGDAALLPSITVNGNRESPVGPVSGYIATRTMAAGKDDSALAETPQSVTVVTRDQMNDQGAQTITDALHYVAGVNTSAYGEDPRYDWITMRGFNQSVFGMYRDGLRASGSKIGMRIDSYGLERLEVLKGPSSVLYGQNSPGGLINAVTKRPTDDPLHEVTLGVGSHDRKQAQFDLGGPATADGTLLYRLTGNVRDSDTQMRYAPDDHAYIAPALTWKPNADLSLTVLANYQHDRAAWGLWYPRTGTLFSSPWGQISSSFYPGEPDFNRFDRTQKSLGTLLEYKLGGDAVFRQGLRVETMNYDAKYVRGRALLNDDYDLDESGHLLYRDANRNQLRSRVYTMDNQLAWTAQTGPVTHRLLVGLDASLTRYNDRQWSGSAPVLDILDPQYGQPIPDPTSPWARDVTARQTGIYFQDRLSLGEHWILRGGVRHDRARTETRDPLGTLDLNQRDSATTYQAGALYRADNGLSPFVNYAESFQPTAQASKDGSPYQPTRGRSVEAGLRYQPPGEHMMLTASVYDIRQNNVLTQDPNDPTNSIQAGQVRSRGIELEGTWEPTPQWSVLASYTFLDAKVTRSNTPGQEGTRPQDGWGTTSPRHMASLWVNYRLASTALRGVSIGGGVRYMGSTLDYGPTAADPDNAYATSVKTPAYTVYDMVLGYEPNAHWRMQFKVANLFDKLYVANPCGGSPLNACYYGPRRTLLLSTTYRW